jgi:hypothetical protein
VHPLITDCPGLSFAPNRGVIIHGMSAGYLKLTRSGELTARATRAWKRLKNCDLCALGGLAPGLLPQYRG